MVAIKNSKGEIDRVLTFSLLHTHYRIYFLIFLSMFVVVVGHPHDVKARARARACVIRKSH